MKTVCLTRSSSAPRSPASPPRSRCCAAALPSPSSSTPSAAHPGGAGLALTHAALQLRAGRRPIEEQCVLAGDDVLRRRKILARRSVVRIARRAASYGGGARSHRAARRACDGLHADARRLSRRQEIRRAGRRRRHPLCRARRIASATRRAAAIAVAAGSQHVARHVRARRRSVVGLAASIPAAGPLPVLGAARRGARPRELGPPKSSISCRTAATTGCVRRARRGGSHRPRCRARARGAELRGVDRRADGGDAGADQPRRSRPQKRLLAGRRRRPRRRRGARVLAAPRNGRQPRARRRRSPGRAPRRW